MLYTISHLASLAKIPVEWAIAAATGNNAEVYRLNSGYLRPGQDADVVVIDACAGGSQDNALDALRNGDIAAVARRGFGRHAAICRAEPKYARSDQECPGRGLQTAAGFHRRFALSSCCAADRCVGAAAAPCVTHSLALTKYETGVLDTAALPIFDISKSNFMPNAPVGARQRESVSP